MACRASLSQDHACDLVRRDVGDDGRLDLVPAEDHGIVADLRLLDAENVFGDALADVADVGGALAEIRIVHLLENCRLFLRRVEHCQRSVRERFDLRVHRLFHHRILREHAVRFKNSRLLRHPLRLQRLDVLLQYGDDSLDGILDLLVLNVLVAGRISFEVAVNVLACHHDRADRNAGDDALAAQTFCHMLLPHSWIVQMSHNDFDESL